MRGGDTELVRGDSALRGHLGGYPECVVIDVNGRCRLLMGKAMYVLFNIWKLLIFLLWIEKLCRRMMKTRETSFLRESVDFVMLRHAEIAVPSLRKARFSCARQRWHERHVIHIGGKDVSKPYVKTSKLASGICHQ